MDGLFTDGLCTGARFKMAPEEMATVLRSPNQLCNYVFFPTIFVNYFVQNVSATVSYGRQELLDIRTAITHLRLDKDFFNNNSSSSKEDSHDILQTTHRADIPIIRKRKRRRGQRAGCLGRTRRKQLGKLPIPSILLSNAQLLDNKLDDLRSRISNQRDIKKLQYPMLHGIVAE